MTAPHTPAAPSSDQLQARLGHLNMVQATIGRMAGFSANAKTFTLTIGAALIAVAFDKDLPILFYAGFCITVVFALLDAYYLALEKSFRDLYSDISSRDWTQAFNFAIRPRATNFLHVSTAMASASVWGFYLVLLASFAMLAHVQKHGQLDANTTQLSSHIASRSEHGHASSAATEQPTQPN